MYAILCPIFFEMDNALGEGDNFVLYKDKTITYSQQQVLETECKSPCPSCSEMWSECMFRND